MRLTSLRPIPYDSPPDSDFGWGELPTRMIWGTPPTPVAHQAWAVSQLPPGKVGDRLALAMNPLRAGTWPLVQWVWRVQPSPLLLNGTLERKIKRLELAVGDREASELGPRRDEWTTLVGLRAMRDAIVFQGESLIESDAVVTVTSTPELLEDDVLLLLARWESLGMVLRPLTYEQEWAVLRTWGGGPLPTASTHGWRDRLWQLLGGHPAAPTWEPRVTTAHRLADCVWPGWGMVSDEAEHGVYIGHTDQGQPTFVNFFQDEGGNAANLLAVGATGMGKSFWMKTVIRGLLEQGFSVTVFDVDGEYRALCAAEGGTWIDVSGMQAGTYPDPFAIPSPVGNRAEDAMRWDRMLNTVSQLMQILGDWDLITAAAAQQAIITAWGRYGVSPDDPATWDRPMDAPHPTMSEVWTILHETETPEAQNAAKRLWVYIHGSQRYLFAGVAHAWQAMPTPLVVWHLGNLATQGGMVSSTIPPETAGRYLLVLSATWEWLRARRQQHEWTAIVVDEGQRILNQPILGRAIVDLASTIRKWNGILTFATNSPAPLWQTATGQGIWDTTPIKAFLRLEKNQAKEAANALNMPQAVMQALSEIPERQLLVRLWHDQWTSVRAMVPPEEEALYRTRSIRH